MTLRSLSGTERLWLVADALLPPFVNQLVLEGRGALSTAEVARAVERAAVRAPGLASRLVGRWVRTRWEAGPLPAVRAVDGTLWTGRDPDGAPFLRAGLDPWRGPVAEVLLVGGRPPRVVVRTHHAAADGRGTVLLAEALFAALRGGAIPEVPAGPDRDIDVVAALPGGPEARVADDCAPVTGGAPEGSQPRWGRRTVAARGQVLARVVAALAAATPGEGPARVDVSVDLRRHRPGLVSSANLSGLVRLDARAIAGAADPVGAARVALDAALARAEDAAFVRRADTLRGVPVPVAVALARRSRRRHGYGTSATVSNLGRLDTERLSGGGFVTETAFFVPPASPAVPLFLALTGTAGRVEVVGASPATLAGGLAGVLDAVAHALVT